jgi:MFS family permease
VASSQQSARHPAAIAAADAIPWLTISVVMTALFMAVLDSFIVVVAGPSIAASLHAAASDVQWVLAGYQLSYAVFIITGTRLADRYGRKRIFLAGVSLFTLSSVACALSPGAGSLIAARVIQGLGAAMMVPQVFASVTVLVPAAGRHRVYGVLGVVMGMATIGGQVIGGLLIGANLLGSGWRAVFWVNVPIGIAMLLLAARYVPATRPVATRKLDGPGVAALSAALFLLVLPLIQGQQAGWPGVGMGLPGGQRGHVRLVHRDRAGRAAARRGSAAAADAVRAALVRARDHSRARPVRAHLLVLPGAVGDDAAGSRPVGARRGAGLHAGRHHVLRVQHGGEPGHPEIRAARS